jgi:hypothetical protein
VFPFKTKFRQYDAQAIRPDAAAAPHGGPSHVAHERFDLNRSFAHPLQPLDSEFFFSKEILRASLESSRLPPERSEW